MVETKPYGARALHACLTKPKTVYHRYEYYYHCGCGRVAADTT